MNGADALCDTLLANEIDVCFANPGTSEMHFVAALDRKPAMRCVLGLFEGVVTGAADGYARMAERPAATLMHLGPGLANGLANVHNAKRGNSPMVNIVGDHATYHLPFDAPLTTDIESLARPMSHWVRRADTASDVTHAAAAAITAARTPPGRIANLILPADSAWNPAPPTIARSERIAPRAIDAKTLDSAARALKTEGATTTILLSGLALRATSQAIANRIAQVSGARLLAQQSNARAERGAGRVMLDRVPYLVDRAVATFAETTTVILIGARAPVGFFAYPGKPSSMLPPACKVITLATPADDIVAALTMLAEAIAAPRDLRAILGERAPLTLPTGALNQTSIAQAIVTLAPEGAILIDESVSSGRDFFPMSYGAAPHDFLQVTGGAIGSGIPMATGAAVAAPGRKVIGMQADGSGMYTLQGLWTQARERLDVVTVIFANRKYNILLGELKQVGATAEPGHNARRMLDLVDPALDWVSLARGMGVEAARASDATGFNDLLKSAMGRSGPFLIEAVI